MALYTTQVKTICESALGRTVPGGFDEIKQILEASAPLVFNFDFPIWDENYRLTLETKILKHYYMREIGAETVGLWKLWLDERLNLIMPYYNELYRTTVLEFNPLYDVDLTTEHKGNNDRKGNNVSQEVGENSREAERGGNSTRSDTSNNARQGIAKSAGKTHDEHVGGDTSRFSDTPQGTIDDLAKDKYLTNATINSNQFTDNGTSQNEQVTSNVENGVSNQKANFTENDKDKTKSNVTKSGQEAVKTTEEYSHHVFGANGNRTYVSKVMELRNALINIDKMIIDELSDLFLGLWG